MATCSASPGGIASQTNTGIAPDARPSSSRQPGPNSVRTEVKPSTSPVNGMTRCAYRIKTACVFTPYLRRPGGLWLRSSLRRPVRTSQRGSGASDIRMPRRLLAQLTIWSACPGSSRQPHWCRERARPEGSYGEIILAAHANVAMIKSIHRKLLFATGWANWASISTRPRFPPDYPSRPGRLWS